jgi:protein O-mannosyl-transferase
LAVFYPHPRAWPAEVVMGSGLVLLALCVLVIWGARRAPYLVTGWFWFLGVLVPMIGIVQAGDQAMADRFAYVPLIGLFIMVAWGGADLAAGRGGRDIGMKAASVLALVACVLLTSRQLPHWQNTVALFRHALAVTPDNAIARLVLGAGLQSQGQKEQALAEYRAAVALEPSVTRAYYNMAVLLQTQGKWAEAAEQHELFLRGNPAHYDSHFYLAEILQRLDRGKEAVSHLREALRIKPDAVEALNNLAWALATSHDSEVRNGAEAVRLAERACELTRYETIMLVGTLAAAYAEAGRFADAVTAAEQACALASKANDSALLGKNQELLQLYRAGRPYHEPASPAPSRGRPAAVDPSR